MVDENEALHREVAALQRTVDVEQAAEIARLKRQLASAGQSQVPASSSSSSRYPSTEAAELAERVRSLEGEVLARDDAALSLRFEAEQASARADRLQRRVDKLFKDLAEGAAAAAARFHRGGKDVAGRHARQVQELEDVVEALKKVVEKQQGELAGLRGQAAAARAERARARAKELRLKFATWRATWWVCAGWRRSTRSSCSDRRSSSSR